ncbi:MAG: hypothetical protein E7Z92_03620 [Cyanobacteria bacterium SIG31]|nr:hypothetical protein [Cyanobacteria bacterium SIG31]
MNIKIYPTFNYNSLQKSSQNHNEHARSTQISNQNVSFKASLVLKKANIQNPNIQKLNDKIVSYIQKLPDLAKLSKPIIIDFKDGVAGFLVDKTRNNGTFVNIKIADNLKALTNWDCPQEPFLALEMTINKAGQMINGIYYSMPERMTYAFTRSPKNVRRIEHGNATYKPVNDNSNLWLKNVPHVVDYQYYSTAQKMEFNETELQKYFSELAKRETSIFLK